MDLNPIPPVKKPRLEWLDALRGFTMILVVAYHVCQQGFMMPAKVSSSMPFLVLFHTGTTGGQENTRTNHPYAGIPALCRCCYPYRTEFPDCCRHHVTLYYQGWLLVYYRFALHVHHLLCLCLFREQTEVEVMCADPYSFRSFHAGVRELLPASTLLVGTRPSPRYLFVMAPHL